MKKNIKAFGTMILGICTKSLTTGRLIIALSVFVVSLILLTVILSHYVLPRADIDSLGSRLTYVVQFYCLGIFLIWLTSILLEFKHGGDIFEGPDFLTLIRDRKWDMHWHKTYSKLAGFGITLIALLYTIFSDVFSQQGNPVTPVLYGLINNETKTNIGEEVRKKDTVHLIYLLDVSGSTKQKKTSLRENRVWIDALEDSVLSIHDLKSEAAKHFNGLNKELDGLTVLKFKACELLFKERARVREEKEKFFLTSFLTFGQYTDYRAKQIDIRDSATFTACIESILGLKYTKYQSDSTILKRAITKLDELVDGAKDTFKSQKNKVTILSDFKMDTLRSNDTSLLKLLITRIADKSTFFNLFLINTNDKLLKGELSVLPFFKNYAYPKLIKVYNIDSIAEMQNTFFMGKEIVFIVDENFHTQRKNAHILYQPQDSLTITFVNERSPDDEWQQFFMNDKAIRFQRKYPKPIGGFDLQFSGHVINQFSGVRVDFGFPTKKTIISSEIIFKKGLNPFVAMLILWLLYYLFYFTSIYTLYLLCRAITAGDLTIDQSPKQEKPATKSEFKLGVPEIKKMTDISQNDQTMLQSDI